MGPVIWSAPPVILFIIDFSGSLSVLTGQFALEGIDSPLGMAVFCR